MAEVDVVKILSASRLYRSFSTTRQDELIRAANAPMNVKLVQQLADYLDPEYRTKEYLDHPAESDAESEPAELDLSDDFGDAEEFGGTDSPSGPPPRMPSGSLPSGSPSSGMEGPPDMDNPPDTDSEDVPEDSEVPGMNVVPDAPGPDDEVAEATNIMSDDITQSIKDILESDEATAGVSRVVVRDDGSELWIYYQDRINLNRLMTLVVDSIESHGYDQLSFNRLARSDNAIVFEIHQ